MVITGDLSQIDLPTAIRRGLPTPCSGWMTSRASASFTCRERMLCDIRSSRESLRRTNPAPR